MLQKTGIFRFDSAPPLVAHLIVVNLGQQVSHSWEHIYSGCFAVAYAVMVTYLNTGCNMSIGDIT